MEMRESSLTPENTEKEKALNENGQASAQELKEESEITAPAASADVEADPSEPAPKEDAGAVPEMPLESAAAPEEAPAQAVPAAPESVEQAQAAEENAKDAIEEKPASEAQAVAAEEASEPAAEAAAEPDAPAAEVQEQAEAAEETAKETEVQEPASEAQAVAAEAAAEPDAPAAEAQEQAEAPKENAPEPEAAAEEAKEPAGETPQQPATKESIVEATAALAEKEAKDISREELARLKQQFYAIRNEELEQEKAQFLAKGNEEAAFAPVADPAEEKFKELLNAIKEKKAELAASIEAQKKINQERKLKIIEELSEMSADTDNVNRLFPKFKELQQEFKSIGDVMPTAASEIWKKYQDAVERYYDQLKINKDLRDYDFKKNLDTKLLLCSEAENLVNEHDVIVAFRRLQDLHVKWRETGPVAKDMREEIWARFKDASAQINKKYQAYFEERKAKEQENEIAKQAICERVEALDFDSLKSYASWNEMTKKILQAQEDWKKLGFASRKSNNQLFARFRVTCDKFFEMKAAYFKSSKDEMTANLEKKVALCEKAEALKESTDWKQTTAALVALQKEWKTIGPVSKKHSDAVWHRFLEACDYFFEQKKKTLSGTRQAEQENLKQKRGIIEELNAITDETPREEAVAKVKELMERWQQIGHVPFRDKDKIHDAYRNRINQLYDQFEIKEAKNMANFESSVEEMEGDENKLYRERERLMRSFELKRNELLTYENNLGFFNSKSKSGDSMLKELERKIQRIKDDLATLEKKIEVIDSRL